MQAFLIEKLFPTGLRRTGDLYWRITDAVSASERMLADRDVRGVRILPVRIQSDAVWEQLADELEVSPA